MKATTDLPIDTDLINAAGEHFYIGHKAGGMIELFSENSAIALGWYDNARLEEEKFEVFEGVMFSKIAVGDILIATFSNAKVGNMDSPLTVTKVTPYDATIVRQSGDTKPITIRKESWNSYKFKKLDITLPSDYFATFETIQEGDLLLEDGRNFTVEYKGDNMLLVKPISGIHARQFTPETFDEMKFIRNKLGPLSEVSDKERAEDYWNGWLK